MREAIDLKLFHHALAPLKEEFFKRPLPEKAAIRRQFPAFSVNTGDMHWLASDDLFGQIEGGGR